MAHDREFLKGAVMANGSDRQSDRGFTLVELLVVIAVMGILASIALPALLEQRRKGWDAAVESDLRNAAMVQETVLAGTGDGAFATTVAQLESVGFRPSPGPNYFGGNFGMTVSATAGVRYCMTARSGSGTYFGFSTSAGLVSKSGPLDAETCS